MKHDVKVKYTYRECMMMAEHYRCPCNGYIEGCKYYTDYGKPVERNCGHVSEFLPDILEIKQTSSVFYQKYEDDFEGDVIISLKIGNKDYSQYWIKYLEVDGEVFHKED